ncbi:MAG: 30S ribosomal protein S3, partial [bacterium]
GHKVHPKSFRLPVKRDWASRWFSKDNYPKLLRQDVELRKLIQAIWKEAGVESVEIERGTSQMAVNVTIAKPGVAIGRGGQGADELKKKIAETVGLPIKQVALNVKEVVNIGASAQLAMQQMALEIEKRLPFRRVMKTSIERIMKAGALGVRVVISGRLNGAEIARTETLAQGKVPLHTLRADIDYARGAAFTTYGAIGIKVWVYKGEVFHN